MTLNLTPEIAKKLKRQARKQRTTPELVALDLLNRHLEDEGDTETGDANNLAEFLGDFIGAIDSREIVPGGAQMSVDSGRAFAEGMMKKRRHGRI